MRRRKLILLGAIVVLLYVMVVWLWRSPLPQAR